VLIVVVLAVQLYRFGNFIGNRPAAEPRSFAGTVARVLDGDTITVRLEGVDAPERKQSHGPEAAAWLAEQVRGRSVRVEWTKRDRYGRTIGDVYLGGRWINRELVAKGHAWHYKQYSKDARLAEAQRIAQKKRVALWAADDPVPPWEFRKRAADSNTED
jgi:endonuclease YncB( thermonuclease family)